MSPSSQPAPKEALRTTEPTSRAWLRWALSVPLGALLLALVALRMPVVPRQFEIVEMRWLYCAIALHIPYMLLRATRLRWCLRLAPDSEPSRAAAGEHLSADPSGPAVSAPLLLGSGFVGFFMTMLLPLRLGELARPALLARSPRAPIELARGLGAVTIERLVDGLVVVGLLFVGIWLHPPVSDEQSAAWVLWAGRMTALTFGVAVAVLIALAARPDWVGTARARLPPGALADALASGATKFTAPLRSLARPWWSAPFLLETLGYWAITVLQLQWVAWSVGLSFDLAAAAVCVAIIGLSIQIPGGPAQVGSYQVGAMGALALLAPSEVEGAGASFAALMYIVQILGVTLFAPIGLLLLRADRATEGAGGDGPGPRSVAERAVVAHQALND